MPSSATPFSPLYEWNLGKFFINVPLSTEVYFSQFPLGSVVCTDRYADFTSRSFPAKLCSFNSFRCAFDTKNLKKKSRQPV